MTDNIAKYKKEFLDNLPSIFGKDGTTYELEVKFNDVTQKDHSRLMEFLDGLNLQKTKTMETDYSINRERKTSTLVYRPDGTQIYEITTLKKTPIHKKDSEDYNFKIRLSSETVRSKKNMASDSGYDERSVHTRVKERTSYSTGVIRFDLTKVDVKEKIRGRSYINYEIEIEIVAPIDESSFDELERGVYYVIQALRIESVNLYTHKERIDLIHFYNKILDAPKTNILDKTGNPILSHFVMSNARNLRLSDCRDGHIYSDEKDAYRYSFTHKADGIRRLLIFGETGIWLVYAPYIFNLLFRYEDFKDNKEAYSYLTSLVGSIFDGEEIQKNMRVGMTDSQSKSGINAEHFYVPFDCMALGGDRSIQKMDLFARQSSIDILSIFNKIPNPILSIYRKEFLEVNSPERMFTILGDLEKKRDQLPFQTDGYLVTPINSPYFTDLSMIPLHRRNLKENPEICKLKPEDELTIDMRRVDESDGKINLYVNKVIGRGAAGKTTITPIIFTGSTFNKFGPENILWDKEILNDSKNNDIIEFKPIFPKNLGGKILLTPKMIRTEKTRPNKEEIANAVWDDIHRPFKIKTLYGETFDLVRQYHNQVKKSLIKSIHDDAQVIDIGFGRGGDINKFNGPGSKKHKGFSKFLAVEPSLKNIEEFEGRKKSIYNWDEISTKFKLLNMYGQDRRLVSEAADFFGWKEGVPSGKPLVISMMISLSFFFGPDNGYINLQKNILEMSRLSGASSVTFIGMTVDGDSVKRMFGNERKMNLGVAQMTFDGKNTVTVNVEDSIVQNQTEYLVPTKTFLSELKPVETHIEKCDNETILSENEKIFSSTFVTFIATLKEGEKGKIDAFPKRQTSSFISTYKPPVILHPHFKTDEKGNDYVKVANDDDANSIFACIGNIGIINPVKKRRVKESGPVVRNHYLRWLMSECKERSYTQANTNDNSVEPEFRSKMTRNANFFVHKPYMDKFPIFKHLHDWLLSSHPFRHEQLDLIGYCFGIKISVVNDDSKQIGEISNFAPPSPNEKVSTICITDNGSKYYNIALKRKDGKLTY